MSSADEDDLAALLAKADAGAGEEFPIRRLESVFNQAPFRPPNQQSDSSDSSPPVQPRGLWCNGGVVDRVDKALSRPFFMHTLPQWLEVALSVPGTWFACPTTAICVLPFAIAHIGNIGAGVGEDDVGTRTLAAVSLGAALSAHLWLTSQSLLMTETEAPTPAQLASLKTEGLTRLYRVVPQWGAKGMFGTMVLGPHLVGGVIGAVGPACSVGAARFYQTAMFSGFIGIVVIKYVVKRGRPVLDPAVRRVPRHLPQLRWMLRVADSHAAFPSGDAAAAATFLVATRMVGPPAVANGIAPLAALALYGRMYFHAHHLLDVTVGAVMGGLTTHFLPKLCGQAPAEFRWTHVAVAQAGLMAAGALLKLAQKKTPQAKSAAKAE